jgi:hypothetical protein
MATRIPILALLLSLAACATQPTVVMSPDAGEALYLQGITTRYSIRLDDLDPVHAGVRAKQLHNGLVSGDTSLILSTSLLRYGDEFTLDLVIQNRGSEPFDLYRANLQARDNTGRRLLPTVGFAGAELFGLRGRTAKHLARGYAPDASGNGNSSSFGAPTGTRAVKGMSSVGVEMFNLVQPSSDWLTQIPLEVSGSELPELITVDGGERRVYWSYWHGPDVEYPIMVTVAVNGRRLLFKFEE